MYGAVMSNRKRLARAEMRAAVLKAMAHSTRLLILDELAGGERCVCELHALVGGDMSTVSKHLSVLKAVGLVSDRRQGTMIFYRLECPCINELLGCVERTSRAAIQAKLASLQ